MIFFLFFFLHFLNFETKMFANILFIYLFFLIVMYTIEFQKRGMPYAHLLLFLHPLSKYPTPKDIDKIICAEIPSKNEQNELYSLVQAHMIHGSCGIANQSSPCMKDGNCSRFYSDTKRTLIWNGTIRTHQLNISLNMSIKAMIELWLLLRTKMLIRI